MTHQYIKIAISDRSIVMIIELHCLCVLPVCDSYPLFVGVHISNSKVVFLEQVVMVTHMVQQELAFGVSLERNQTHGEHQCRKLFQVISVKYLHLIPSASQRTSPSGVRVLCIRVKQYTYSTSATSRSLCNDISVGHIPDSASSCQQIQCVCSSWSQCRHWEINNHFAFIACSSVNIHSSHTDSHKDPRSLHTKITH